MTTEDLPPILLPFQSFDANGASADARLQEFIRTYAANASAVACAELRYENERLRMMLYDAARFLKCSPFIHRLQREFSNLEFPEQIELHLPEER